MIVVPDTLLASGFLAYATMSCFLKALFFFSLECYRCDLIQFFTEYFFFVEQLCNEMLDCVLPVIYRNGSIHLFVRAHNDEQIHTRYMLGCIHHIEWVFVESGVVYGHEQSFQIFIDHVRNRMLIMCSCKL